VYVPLVVNGRAVGVVAAHDKIGTDPRFGDEDVRLAESLAARAAIALALSERVSRDAVRRVVEAQEVERKRLARELHDETGQALTSILLGLRTLEQGASEEDRERVAGLRELVVSTLQDVRRLAVELRPAALDDFGLAAALERLAETHRAHDGVAIDVEIGLEASERLPTEVETTVYRIVQEALTNVARHADAARISILVTRKNDSVVAVIEDDGAGFDPASVGDDSLGLAGIRERVALLGGRLLVEAAPGKGTTLAAEVPLQ
jgi:signal transduction histidine kinase